MTAGYIAVAIYATLVVCVGFLGARRVKRFRDYLLGGGSIGAWMTAFSYGTAYFSAVVFIGFAGKVGWSFGMSGLWLAAGNTLVGVLLCWKVIGTRVKKASVELGVETMPEYFLARFGSRFLKVLSALVIFIFLVPYTAAVFMGLTFLFKITFDIPYEYVLLFIGVFTAAYLVLGGYRSMASLDVFFGIIMIAGVGILVCCTLGHAGSPGEIVSRLREVEPALASVVGPPGVIPLLSLVILVSVPPLAMPQLVQKFMAVCDEAAIRRGMWISAAFAVIAAGGAYFAGSVARIAVSPVNNPGAFDQGGGVVADAVMPELLKTVVPENLLWIILLLVLAASMSTLAALVLVSSATVTRDLLSVFSRKEPGDGALTTITRVVSVVYIAGSMVLAWTRPGIIVTVLSISWGAIGAALLGPFLWGLFSKRTGAFAAGVSGVAGLVAAVVLFGVMGASRVPEASALAMALGFASCPVIDLMVRFFSSGKRGSRVP